MKDGKQSLATECRAEARSIADQVLIRESRIFLTSIAPISSVLLGSLQYIGEKFHLDSLFVGFVVQCINNKSNNNGMSELEGD